MAESRPTAGRIMSGPSLPATCNTGAGRTDSFILTTTSTMYVASGTNVWTPAGAATTWGGITGTLSSQSDLQTALNLKANLISPSFTTPVLGVASATSLQTSGGGVDIKLGGSTSSFPAIKRNSTALNFRLADDSGDAPITCGTIVGTSLTTGNGTAGSPVIKNGSNSGLYYPGSSFVGISIGGSSAWYWHSGKDFRATTDNSYDIGTTGAERPRTVYVGTSVFVGASKVLGPQGAAVADATDAASVILRLNDLLARLRAATGHGLIA